MRWQKIIFPGAVIALLAGVFFSTSACHSRESESAAADTAVIGTVCPTPAESPDGGEKGKPQHSPTAATADEVPALTGQDDGTGAFNTNMTDSESGNADTGSASANYNGGAASAANQSVERTTSGTEKTNASDSSGKEPAPSVSTPASTVPAPATSDSKPADTAAGADDSNGATQPSGTNSGKKPSHTTSIYTDDESTLLRVEYYDDDNKLYEYSSVSNYDKDTTSYTEEVYRWDNENQVQVPVRTDTYENGELIASESH